MPLPSAAVSLSLAETLSAEGPGFLQLCRVRLVLGGESFDYDTVTRKAMDAVVVVAHFFESGVRHVVLRSAVRPPIWLRDRSADPVFWELPAGLVEPGETLEAAAVRELEEETGARVVPSALSTLGPPMMPAPAVMAEVQTFFHTTIDPLTRTAPGGDGSALERHAVICTLPLSEALGLVANGLIRDAKTELGLRRLAELR